MEINLKRNETKIILILENELIQKNCWFLISTSNMCNEINALKKNNKIRFIERKNLKRNVQKKKQTKRINNKDIKRLLYSICIDIIKNNCL